MPRKIDSIYKLMAVTAAIVLVPFLHSLATDDLKPQPEPVTVTAEPVAEVTEQPEKVTYTPTLTPEPIELTTEEETMLLQIMMAEAESEDRAVKALVGLAVLNRMENPLFPDTMEEVLFQQDQFTPVWDGRYYTVTPDEECYEALALIESGWDSSQGCMWFESCADGSAWHMENLELVYQLGKMRFYREK